jgi:hypothetical protein
MFQEVFTSAGVDETASPPGMTVPLGPGNFNIVRLTGGTGLHLEHPKTVIHEELSGSVLLTWASMSLRSWGFGVDFPFTLQPDTRYFKISSTLPQRRVDVTAVGRRGVEARLQVAVLPPRKVDLSIRPVQVRAGPQSDGLVFHSKKPFDVNAMVDHMNLIWRQANVVFNLVSSTPAPIIDEAKISKAYGFYSNKPLPEMVVINRVRDILNDLKDPKAELTLFLVQQCGHLDLGGSGQNITSDEGVSDHEFPVGLISDGRTNIHELLAHEAGHLIGRRFNSGKNFPDLDASLPANKYKLMKDGGDVVAKIPLDDAVKYFNQP